VLTAIRKRRSLLCTATTRAGDQARASLFDYMELFYNRQRRHSTINYVAPLAFEASSSA
jgi:putative transposase